jgi:hypothetical protein
MSIAFEALDPKRPATLENVYAAFNRLEKLSSAEIARRMSEDGTMALFPFGLESDGIRLQRWDEVVEAAALSPTHAKVADEMRHVRSAKPPVTTLAFLTIEHRLRVSLVIMTFFNAMVAVATLFSSTIPSDLRWMLLAMVAVVQIAALVILEDGRRRDRRARE